MSTPLDRLKSIHERMQGVTEEEVLSALNTEAEPVCRNCRHWRSFETYSECLMVKTKNPDYKARLYGPRQAELATEENFGCNQFEAKGSA